MRLLVIGASSFIGRYIYALAKTKGYQTLGTRFLAQMPGLVPFNLLTDRIADVIPASFLKKDGPVNAVICAAIPKIDLCWNNREESYKMNVLNTIRLLEDLNRLGAKSAFLSSESVYDGKQGYYNESIQPSPLNEYGRQKAEVEFYMAKNLPENLVLRLSMIVADEPKEPHLLAQWYRWIQEGKPIRCIAGQIFSPTYINDVAYGILEAFKRGLHGLYNLTNSEFFAREEFARQFLKALNKDAQIAIQPLEMFGFAERRSMKTYLDGTKFNRAVSIRFTSMREVFKLFAAKVNAA